MDLIPREKDELLIFIAALLAERRMARGVKLNYLEAVTHISAAILRVRDALWKPVDFGAKPATDLTGGMIAAAAMGAPKFSIPGTGRCYAAAVLRGPPEVTS